MLTIRRRPLLVRLIRECFFRGIDSFRKMYWRICKPHRPGVKVFVVCEGKILMVRLGYAHKSWVLPGGGIEGKELPEVAAQREVLEETGLTLSKLHFIGKRFYENEGKRVTVSYFVSETTESDLVIDDQEIVDAGWFMMDALPEPIRPRLQEEIALYNNWKQAV